MMYSWSLASFTVELSREDTSNFRTPTMARLGCFAYASMFPQFPGSSGRPWRSDASCAAENSCVFSELEGNPPVGADVLGAELT